MTKLPEPDTHCEDLDTGKDVWSYSRELVEQIVRNALEAQELETARMRSWIDVARAELEGVEVAYDNNCLSAAKGALERALPKKASHG